ncbi:FluG domain-containing protein [Blastomyces dermatitidis ER-3]|uniref:FluG domain-containing protein n=1 Tax=Ajellomyces dermatitidis (strain ER-3 / ATCC MYA-2586) TaxID=559297 RepID=A0ABP2ENM5_AJEDR|nr:FluG domain-containing protein [Blastomyces dermatitidis ER-3]EEQ84735.2 FluG domain-containing protein [Blastomyces dermatitidis ER-3]
MGILPRKAPVKMRPGYWMDMISKPSQPVKPEFEESTKRSYLGSYEQEFREVLLPDPNFFMGSLLIITRFVQCLQPADPRYWFENLTMNVIEYYLRWYLEGHNVRSLLGFQVKVRYCLKVFYITNRQRSQHATLQKMMTATSAHPGTLVCNTGYCRKEKDALRWGDIELFMVMDPERPTCKVLLMHVKHRLNKGKRNNGRAPRYIYIERNDNLGLYVIQDILEYVLEDQVFASEFIQEPRDIWCYTDIPAHRKSVPIHIKAEKHHIPIFRRAARNGKGKWITHPTGPLTYAQLAEDHHRECRAAGAKDTALAALDFKNRDVSIVPDEECVEDRMLSLELRLALNRLTVPRHLARRVKPEVPAQDILSDFPTQAPTSLECPECLGDDRYPEAREFSYCNIITTMLRRHQFIWIMKGIEAERVKFELTLESTVKGIVLRDASSMVVLGISKFSVTNAVIGPRRRHHEGFKRVGPLHRLPVTFGVGFNRLRVPRVCGLGSRRQSAVGKERVYLHGGIP